MEHARARHAKKLRHALMGDAGSGTVLPLRKKQLRHGHAQRSPRPNRRTLSSGSSLLHDLRNEIFMLTNAARAAERLPLLSRNTLLDFAAQNHAEDMYRNRYYEHDSLDGRTFADRIRKEGYVGLDPAACRCRIQVHLAENIAKGQQTPAQVVNQWLASPEHWENILSTSFADIGIGVYENLWVQDFGSLEVKFLKRSD
jgi:uncharacterized protein YkwD